MVTDCLRNTSMFYLCLLKTIWLLPSAIIMSNYLSSSPKSPYSLCALWFESAHSESAMVGDLGGPWATMTCCWRRQTSPSGEPSRPDAVTSGSHSSKYWGRYRLLAFVPSPTWIWLFSTQLMIQQGDCYVVKETLFHSYRICSTFHGISTWVGEDGEEGERESIKYGCGAYWLEHWARS